MTKIAIIGAGAMGGAIATGLINNGYNASNLTVADPSDKVVEHFAALGAAATTDNVSAISDADMVMVVVKPWLVEKVLAGIRHELRYDSQSVVLIAAGISSEQLCDWLRKPDGQLPQAALVIPNIAVAIGESMTFVAPVTADEQTVAEIVGVFNLMGSTLVTEERLLAAGTTLASCGIAYAMRYIRAAMEGGVELGIRANDAKHIVMQTLRGAVDVLAASDAHPEAEIDRVTTPGGLTIKGLNAMEAAGFTHSVIEGLRASTKR